MSRDLSSILPGNVMVVFRSRRCNGQPSDLVPTIYKKVVTLEESGWTGAGNGVQGFDGTKVLHDAAIALFNVGGTDPTNKTALDTLAVQLAADHYNWLSVAFDEAFPEIIAPTVDGLTDLIEWGYEIDRLWTRRLSASYNAQPEEFSHHDPANADCKDNLTATPTPVITSKDPGTFEHYGPLATSSSGNLILPVFLSKLQGGLLVQKYSRTDTLPCGCGCVADSNHICSCGCVTPFPKTFYVGDGLSPTLTWNALTGNWQGSAFIANTDTCYNEFLGGPCVSAGLINMEVKYQLAPCLLISGLRYWQLSISFPWWSCQPQGQNCQTPCYGNPAVRSSTVTKSVTIPWTCDFSMLVFSMPTTYGYGPPIYCSDLAIPGGGGSITVTP
ncbi:hypothetical protein SAMN05444166_0150 [Singulisphaera sp. GP187]|uniref:hypothetical protein n=1 Tax=Singulisphaera sp. GP187 TaxID=1882752 RepID=UPI00092C3213|nr:hypothetical protein [Singulisphaera sp. GP187]SIN69123.1 hypothetical protein SAMN05444166_0150 [Singulisphaera sp. GP187]